MDNHNPIVLEARKWICTPFEHTGRTLGVGVDCCGLIICVFNAVYNTNYDNRNYSRVAPAGTMLTELERHCHQVVDWKYGDVLLFNMFGVEQHVAFYTDIGIIHAYQTVNAVVEHELSAVWRRRVAGAYRYNGVNV